MATTTSKKKSDLMKKIWELNEKRKSLEKEVKAMKTDLKEIMGEELALQSEHFLAVRSTSNRSSLDKKALEEEFGTKWVTEHSKVTAVEKMEVKKI